MREVSSFGALWRPIAIVLCCALLGLATAPLARAEDDDLVDIFGGMGTAVTVEDETESLLAQQREGEGSILGAVFDGETGAPVRGVTVIVMWPPPADGSKPRQEVVVSDAGGDYRFPSIPPGYYDLSFIKSGYRTSAIKSFEVIAGEINRADFPMPRLAIAASEDVLQLDAFVVEAATVGDMMDALDLRMEADVQLNIMSAEDFSKFAASDVADALKRVSGVNVVQGRFAVIRGLEDRYSSTLFNGAPVPSSDPLRQSVQLDLFPSDIVSGVAVAKTFEAGTPGNSGAGSINISSMGYPDELTLRVSASTGFNENAIDSFMEYRENSPIAKFNDGNSVIESDINISIGGTSELWDREIRYKGVFAREIDYESLIGVREGREPSVFAPDQFNKNNPPLKSGSLAFRTLPVSDGRFDWQQSQRTEQYTYFGAIGVDIDQDAKHRIDFTGFYTTKDIENVNRWDNGFIPGFDYEAVTPNTRFLQPFLYIDPIRQFGRDFFLVANTRATLGSPINNFRDDPQRPGDPTGPLSTAPVVRGQSVVQDRKLTILQLNGEHDLSDVAEGLEATWAFNYSRSQQDEVAWRMRYWWEEYNQTTPLFIPPFPSQPSDFEGPGSWRTNPLGFFYVDNQIDEQQYFGRGDWTYQFDPASWLATRLGSGFWYEKSNRSLTFGEYFETQPQSGFPGVLEEGAVEGPTEAELGPNVYNAFGLSDLGLPAESSFDREIISGYFDAKLTLFDDLDVIGGVRLEKIQIISTNRNYTGECFADRFSGLPNEFDPTRSGNCREGFLPNTYPTRYLFLDKFDNEGTQFDCPICNEFFPEDPDAVLGGISNADLLGIDLPINPRTGFADLLTAEQVADALTGVIDEFKVFPMASLAYRPLDGLTLRGAYSQTSARPSFRELAFFASIVPGIPDRLVGNPKLVLSDVESFDIRAEYFWGDLGELFAMSFFYKTIDRPVEIIVLYDRSTPGFEFFEGPFRVYRNNENEAKLLGVELETRVTLGLMGHIGNRGWLGHWENWQSFLEYWSLGGNYTYIDASVQRSVFEIQQAEPFFRATPEDIESGRVTAFSLPRTRRLFNQPEWTANADITFDHPDWRTKATLSVFAISDVLNAAGAVSFNTGGEAESMVLDEFTAGFYQLDLVLSQGFDIPRIPGSWTGRVSIKNLTDSERGVVYDREFTAVRYDQLRFTAGRDYTFQLQYQLTF